MALSIYCSSNPKHYTSLSLYFIASFTTLPNKATENRELLHLNSVNYEKNSITEQLAEKSNLFRINLFLAKVFGNGKLMEFPEGNPYKICKSTWDMFNKEYIQSTTKIIKELKGKIDLLIGK